MDAFFLAAPEKRITQRGLGFSEKFCSGRFYSGLLVRAIEEVWMLSHSVAESANKRVPFTRSEEEQRKVGGKVQVERNK